MTEQPNPTSAVEAHPWTEAAVKITGAVSGQIADIARRAAEAMYESLLETTQDYLADNTSYNLQSRLEAAERGRRSEWERAQAAEARIAELSATVITFCAPWATQYAQDHGLPPGHLHPKHYDILAACGGRMVDFTRAEGTPND